MPLIDEMLNEGTKNILNTLRDGIIITDSKGIVRFVNKSYKKFSNLLDEDIVGKYLGDVRPGAVLPSVLQTGKPLLNIPRKVCGVESYNDYFPIIVDNKIIGGINVVKDISNVKELMEMLKESAERIIQLDQVLKNTFKAKFRFNDIVGKNSGLKDIIQICKKAAKNDSPVLLIGESGTGKEVIAQSIHNESNRSNNPFVDINCAALPENLLESELFGYVPGAFTGAKNTGKIGLFELANGGTIFLDEITEIPLNLQTKLLRVLQEKKIRKIGGEKSIELDIKVIAATNKNIETLISERKFRDDLYFRLAVFVIKVPPLRERKEDIDLFINHFLEEHIRKRKQIITIDEEALKYLNNYNWPGNVRELKNAVDYAAYITEDNIIKPHHLPPSIFREQNRDKVNYFNNCCTSLNEYVEKAEKELIKEYLNTYGRSLKSKEKIARLLKISKATLYNKIKKYKL